jgi:hypothetical protein
VLSFVFAGVGRAKEREGRGEGNSEAYEAKGKGKRSRSYRLATIVLNWNGFIISSLLKLCFTEVEEVHGTRRRAQDPSMIFSIMQ